MPSIFCSDFRSDKTRAARFLNGFKNIPQKRVSWESEQRVEGNILAYKKNKLCFISILFLRGSRSVLSGYKAHARDALSVF